MGRDGGWSGIELSGWARGCRRDHLYCNSGTLSISLSLSLSLARFMTHQISLSLPFLLSYSIYRLSPAPILTTSPPPHLCFTLYLRLLLALFAFHVRLRRSSRFMRSLSIFHDSMFYCLYESFYPAFLLARDISLRSVTFYAVSFIIEISDFSIVSPIASFLCLWAS